MKTGRAHKRVTPKVPGRRRLPTIVWPMLAAIAVLFVARGAGASTLVLEIDGFRISSETPLGPRQLATLRQQIALVVALPVDPRVLAFFREQPIIVRPGLDQHGSNEAEGILLSPALDMGDKPVLLHELLHRYHARRLPRGRDNPMVEQALIVARASGDWPVDSYMLSNRAEFFAMTASAVLYGRVARPPKTRANVARNLPIYYRWIVREFGLSGVTAAASEPLHSDS